MSPWKELLHFPVISFGCNRLAFCCARCVRHSLEWLVDDEHEQSLENKRAPVICSMAPKRGNTTCPYHLASAGTSESDLHTGSPLHSCANHRAVVAAGVWA